VQHAGRIGAIRYRRVARARIRRRFSRYTYARVRERLSDRELKFQDISDCLRRLIAPLLLRCSLPLSFSFRLSVSSVRLALRARRIDAHHRRRSASETGAGLLFLAADDSAERSRASPARHVYARRLTINPRGVPYGALADLGHACRPPRVPWTREEPDAREFGMIQTVLPR